MRSYTRIEPRSRTVRDVFFLLAIAIALGLGLGLALASPALGAGLNDTLRQANSGGSISGTVTVTGGNAAGITVELHQRDNDGNDKSLGTTTTDDKGQYTFAGQASAPSDAFYYVKFSGGAGTLADWYSFPIIYLAGSTFTVPSVEMADVQLQPVGAAASLPITLQWKARRSGETYRVFVYSNGDTTKTVLDSGSLGMSTQFTLPAGSLPEGTYSAIVQVRDAVVGYGQSSAAFEFTIAKAPDAAPGSGLGVGQQPGSGGGSQAAPPTSVPVAPPVPAATVTATSAPPQPSPTAEQAPAQPQPQPQPQPQSPAGTPSLQLSLSADRTQLQQGDKMTYKIEVANQGSASAPGVVVTDNLPAGVTVDSSTANSSTGSLAVQGNSVTVQLGDLEANGKAVIEIPVSVNKNAESNVSNQASAQYTGAASEVNSNAYIAQVAAPLASEPQAQPQQPSQGQPQGPSQAPSQSQPQSQPQVPASQPQGSQPAQPPASQPQSPPKSQPQTPAKKPAAASSIPQTGGSFPLVLALLILIVILLARYLRGRSYRRI